MPDTSGLVKKWIIMEGKIPSITGLATTAALTVVENKITDLGNLVKKQFMTQK